MNPTQQKINFAREKSIEWIELLATKSDNYLKNKLETNDLQFFIAEKKKDELAVELLNIMEFIIIQARIYKAENNIPTVQSEMELAIANIETVIIKSKRGRKLI